MKIILLKDYKNVGKAGEMVITYHNSMFDFMIIFAVIISIGTLVCLAELLCFSFRHD